mgnify:FL=1
MMENQTGRKRSNVFEQIMVEIFVYEGIIQHFSVRNTTRQKGVIEHTNQTLLQKVWIVLSNVGLGKQFWVEFVTYACHLINHLPSATNDGTNPLEKWSRKPPMDYGSLDVFGCIAYYHVKESKFMGIMTSCIIFMALFMMAPLGSLVDSVEAKSKPDLVLSYYLLQQVGVNEFATVQAAVPPVNGSLTGFGLQVVYDYPITATPPSTGSVPVIGFVRGTSVVVHNVPGSTVFAVSNVVHYDGDGKKNGPTGTFAQQGEASFSSGKPWEYAIVGGTGDFRRARGYNVGSVVSITRPPSGAPIIVTSYKASIWF